MNKKFVTGKDLEKRVKARAAKRRQRAAQKREKRFQEIYPCECRPLTSEIAKSPEKLAEWVAPRINLLENQLCLESDTRQKGVQKHVDQLIKLIEINQKSDKPDDRVMIVVSPLDDDNFDPDPEPDESNEV